MNTKPLMPLYSYEYIRRREGERRETSLNSFLFLFSSPTEKSIRTPIAPSYKAALTAERYSKCQEPTTLRLSLMRFLFKYSMTFLMFRIFFFFFLRGSSQILFPSFHKSSRSPNAQDLWRKWAFISSSVGVSEWTPPLYVSLALSLSFFVSPSLTFCLPDCAGANLYAPAYDIFIRTA